LADPSGRRSVAHLPGFGSIQLKVPGSEKEIERVGRPRSEGHEDIALATFVLDHTHVARMTFNDCGFEREIFQLFDRQAGLLMERMRGSEPAAIPTLAHSLKGAAADINAGRVSACRCRNGTGRERRAGRCSGAKDQLAQAVDEVRMEIAALQSVG